MTTGHRPLRLPPPLAFLAGDRQAGRWPSAVVLVHPGLALQAAVRNARERLSVTLTRPIASAALAQVLLAAAQRGVHVVVLLPQWTPLTLLWYARVDEWLSAGVQVYQCHRHSPAAAVCVVDDGWASVIFRSGCHPSGKPVDADAALLIPDKAVVRSLRGFFQSQCAAAKPVDAGAWPAPLGWLRWAHHMSMAR